MRELVAMLLFGGICFWMTQLEPGDASGAATGQSSESAGMGFGLADAVRQGLQRVFQPEVLRREGDVSVWFAMNERVVASFTATGRVEDLTHIKVTLWCPRGGVLGKPDRTQLAVSKATVQTLLWNLSAVGAGEWAANQLERFIGGDGAPAEMTTDTLRIRVHFEDVADSAVVEIDRAPKR